MNNCCSIHGRFQPFHNGHLQYFRWAKERYDLVIIGVTQIYGKSDQDFPGAPHRGVATSNPLSFFHRARVIEEALVAEGYDHASFRVLPFPIEDEDSLHLFLPTAITCCTTIHSPWNEKKIGTLRRLGYNVEVLSSDESNVPRASGSEIRRLIRSGDDAWRQFVPRGAAAVIERELMEHFLRDGNETLL